MLGKDDYCFVQKDHWRNWVWSRLAELVDGPRDLVLYLVGPNDADRTCGLRKGFNNQNLVAVDVDASRIDQVRAKGGVGICGTLQQILADWNQEPVAGIIYDACSGLGNDSYVLHAMLNLSPAVDRGCAVAVNLMRGRDADLNCYRESVKGHDAVSDMFDHEKLDMHRGYLFFRFCAAEIVGNSFIMGSRAVPSSKMDAEGGFELTDRQLLMLNREVKGFCKPSLMSYKSESGQVFDSVVFKWPFHSLSKMEDMLGRDGDRRNELIGDALRIGSRKVARRDKKVPGRLAAMKAVRTRRRMHE